MDERDNQRVADILDAAGEIAAIVAGGEDAFRTDRVRQLAVERLLEIVGEAARAMSEAGRAGYPEVPWSDVVGLRTLLARFLIAFHQVPWWRYWPSKMAPSGKHG